MLPTPIVPLLFALQSILVASGCQPATETTLDPLAFSVPAPEEVPLAGKLFEPEDDLAERISQWKAAKKKEDFRRRIVVEKSKRSLTVYADEDALARYPVELGFAPKGDKALEGDGATPEGELYACTRNEASRFHRFLGLSYPRPKDAERGLAQDLISAPQRDAILKAHRDKAQPSWSTPLGGAVGIHGGAKFARAGDKILGYDWTLGCIAVTDEVIEQLFAFVEIGTEIEILP
jgi:murein L,D-transpeptidase YafK